MSSFMNPSISDNSHGSSMNQSISSQDTSERNSLKDLYLALGKIPVGLQQSGSGRTINIPKELPSGVIPGSSFNNGNTIGSPCLGSHCGVSITPTAYNYNNRIIPSIEGSPPGVKSQINNFDRLGNNTSHEGNFNIYTGTKLNSGPFMLQCAGKGMSIMDPNNLKEYSIFTKRGKKIIKNYRKHLKNKYI